MPLTDTAIRNAKPADKARKLLANDIEHHQAQKAAKEDRVAISFEVVAREWHAKRLTSFREPRPLPALCSIADHRPWLCRPHRTFTEASKPDLMSRSTDGRMINKWIESSRSALGCD